MARLVALLLPLSLDTFAIAAALGIAGLPTSQRWRVSLLFVGFEAGMPLVGVAIGQAAGRVPGTARDYRRTGALLAVGGNLSVGAEAAEWAPGRRFSGRPC